MCLLQPCPNILKTSTLGPPSISVIRKSKSLWVLIHLKESLHQTGIKGHPGIFPPLHHIPTHFLRAQDGWPQHLLPDLHPPLECCKSWSHCSPYFCINQRGYGQGVAFYSRPAPGCYPNANSLPPKGATLISGPLWNLRIPWLLEDDQ